MSPRRSLKATTLKDKFLVVYTLMFIIPVLYFVYIIWVMAQQIDLTGESATFLFLQFVVGVPAGIIMSGAAFILMHRSLASVTQATSNAEDFLKELRGEEEAAPDTENDDEAARISHYVNDMIGELRQRLTEVDRYAQDLHTANKKLVDIALNDGLTGLYNHKHAQHLLTVEFERAKRFGHSMCVVMLDIDDFKRFNDTYGHPIGDEALRSVAATLHESLRRVDLPARYGGEEFIVILPETGIDGAMKIAERIRETLAARPFATGRSGKTTELTVSIGVAEFSGQPLSEAELLSKADAALYEAKRAGKNTVKAAP